MPPPTASPTAIALRRDRLARVFDEEVYPLIEERVAQMLLAALKVEPKMQVLEIGCSSGSLTVELARRLDPDSRLCAMDASALMLELGRAKIMQQVSAARRVFFKPLPVGAKLPSGDETSAATLSHVRLGDVPDLAGFVAELVRVTRPGGQVVVATTLRGTWGEFIDIFREVLKKGDRASTLAALQRHVDLTPDVQTVSRALQAAGLEGIEQELARWELLFRSAREFFYAPVVEFGPLPRWKEIAGRGEVMQQIFADAKAAMDTYFCDRAFSVTVFAGCFSARKPMR